MKVIKEYEEIDFCEFCGKDVEKQMSKIVYCDFGFLHYPCKRCYNKIKAKERGVDE